MKDRLRQALARRATLLGKSVKAGVKKVGNFLATPMRKQAEFQRTIRENDPAYQRGQKANYLRNYERFKRGELDEYGNPR